MISTGEYRENNMKSYSIAIEHCSSPNPNKALVVIWNNNEIISVYRKDSLSEKCSRSKLAKKLWDTMLGAGLKKCTAKNGNPQPFVLGTSMLHSYETGKKNIKTGCLELFNKELVACQIEDAEYSKDGNLESSNVIFTQYNSREDMQQWLANIEQTEKFISLSTSSDLSSVKGADNIIIKTVEEIALEKESIEWLKYKKYYIVNDDLEAEKIFQFLESYNGLIAYDVESTGLRINKFGKIGSEDARVLKKYNEENPDKQLRVDKLVGIIFCVEKDVSYYFPVANKKFRNLYEDGEIRNRLIANIKARYTIGDKREFTNDMARFIRETPDEELTPDVILMERVRDILEKKYIGTHFGGYEQKVGYMYDMLLNIVDDSGILHQILHKFRGTTSNRGEPSNLKHLSKVDLGIDQWELKDFFPQYKELVGETNKVSPIDFSLMDYDGTRIYAPADGDCTFQLIKRYRNDLETKYRNREYIYNVELIVLKALAYAEFNGIRFDENKIEEKKNEAIERLLILESYFRQVIDFSSPKEIELRVGLEYASNKAKELSAKGDKQGAKEFLDSSLELVGLLRAEIDSNEKKFNPNSPAQVAEAMYDLLEYPAQVDSKSVDKKKIKALCGSYEEYDGNDQDKLASIKKVYWDKEKNTVPKYIGAHIYKEYKSLVTLLTKFFDKLPEFMYPGGFIFANFGQISTATGRMSCSKPNLQQMPKTITKIVIPRNGCVFVDADYSQIEYRVLAGMAREPFLIDQFANPDNDYHTLQAALMYGVPYEEVSSEMRGDAKSFNFGIPYGMGLGSLAILLVGVNNAVTRALAEEKKALYFANQPLVEQLFGTIKEQAQMYNKTETLWHRTREYSFVRKDGTVNEGAKAAALRQAGNAVIQGSAADIFKIGLARMFLRIVELGLLGKVFISNLVHDEQLLEINYREVNVKKMVTEIDNCMCFKVDDLPPLYIGAGVSKSWYSAKSKDCEIHPHLMAQMKEETQNESLYTDGLYANARECVEDFERINKEYRRRKIINYLTDETNHGKKIHPVIGALMLLAFNTTGNDKASTEELLVPFLEENGLTNLSVETFRSAVVAKEIEEDVDYEDDEETDGEDEFGGYEFNIIDESNNIYGMSLIDWIETFTLVASEELRVVGIDTRKLHYTTLQKLISFLEKRVCEPDEEGAMQIAFLKGGRILERQPIYVKGIDSREFMSMGD